MAKTMSHNEDLPLLAATAVSNMLGLSYPSVVKLPSQGKLPHVRDSAGRRLFRRSDVERLQKERQERGQK
jgi:excisionase family DNA binding protein